MTDRTEWFHKAKWGLFTHFIAHEKWNLDEMTPTKWNAIVDNHNSAKLARQLSDIGAGYFFLTITQTDGYFCSPNNMYDQIMGVKSPERSKCSRRDLVADLSDELAKHGIRLMVYFVGEAPVRDPEAVFAFDYNSAHCQWLKGWKDQAAVDKFLAMKQDTRLAKFQAKWEAVIAEWSRRWGKKVNGWWVDGCHHHKEMYNHPEAPNYGSFAAAMRAGNPDSIIAWNSAELPLPTCPEEDYTAGELGFPVNSALVDCHGRFEKHAQFHILPCPHWHLTKYGPEGVFNIMSSVIGKGGCVTWDTPFNEDGTIADDAYNLFKEISGRLAELKMTSHVKVPRVTVEMKKLPGFAADGKPYDGVASVRLTNTCGEAIKGSIYLDFPPEVVPDSPEALQAGAITAKVTTRDVRITTYPFSLSYNVDCALPVAVSNPLSVEKHEISYDLPFAGDTSEDIVLKNTLAGGRGSVLEVYNKNRKTQIFVPARNSSQLTNHGERQTFLARARDGAPVGEVKFGHADGKLIINVKARDEIMKYDLNGPHNASCIELFAARTTKAIRVACMEELSQIFIIPKDVPEVVRLNHLSGRNDKIIGAEAVMARTSDGYELTASIPFEGLFHDQRGLPDTLLLEAVITSGKDGKYVKSSLFDSPAAFSCSDFYSEFTLKTVSANAAAS